MRVSGDEFLRVSRLRVDPAPVFGTAPVQADAPRMDDFMLREGQRVAKAVASTPDIREEIVASLREQIESGAYRVSGEQIAEMMLRRHQADRIR